VHLITVDHTAKFSLPHYLAEQKRALNPEGSPIYRRKSAHTPLTYFSKLWLADWPEIQCRNYTHPTLGANALLALPQPQ
jgi:hypothetical protein